MAKRILNCPFCGNKAILWNGQEKHTKRVVCDTCYNTTPDYGDSGDTAIRAWNHRIPYVRLHKRFKRLMKDRNAWIESQQYWEDRYTHLHNDFERRMIAETNAIMGKLDKSRQDAIDYWRIKYEEIRKELWALKELGE